MTETIITVQGSHTKRCAAERALVTIAIVDDGADRETVFASVTESAEALASRITGQYDRHSGPIVAWTSASVQVWSERPWNQEGKQLEPVFHASVDFTATFSDFDRLARFIDAIAPLAGVTVSGVSWTLTEGVRLATLDEVRARAVEDAVSKAAIYAQAVGLATVRPIAIADEGMLGDGQTSGGGQGAMAMRMAGVQKVGGPELSLRPDDIEVRAVVDARFSAT